MVKTLVVANWKMNPATLREAVKLFEATRRAAEKAKYSSVIVAPPAIFLRELGKGYRGAKIAFAVQTAHFAPVGAHTGDISLAQAKDARSHYAILGHAERRGGGGTGGGGGKKGAGG